MSVYVFEQQGACVVLTHSKWAFREDIFLSRPCRRGVGFHPRALLGWALALPEKAKDASWLWSVLYPMFVGGVKGSRHQPSFLEVGELRRAEKFIIKAVQADEFAAKIHQL
ncbi:hypothetical protein AVEN_41768-1 [Araneus ventricosus]|uniref:Uncharacterized protein n=1 Tax=Araneus ventricosus TaxID=182803 RepID=A0A4Y2ADM1_ARAVE|nr:hypothetical protein AVEN_41768-1 [Araneus ventricosus]